MAEVEIRTSKIIANIEKLNRLHKKHNQVWTLVTKVVAGHDAVLKDILHHESMNGIHSIGESRISNLRKVRNIRPDLKTMYIKPGVLSYAKQIVELADISLNTSGRMMESLNNEAAKQGKIHEVIVMIELGELREGILRENIGDFFSHAAQMENIRIIGIGSNLGCLHGVEPTYDKLIQLSLYKQVLEAKFNMELPLISGGSSITLPLVSKKRIPKDVNHFRNGESVFLGTSPLTNSKFSTLSIDAFTYKATVVELEEKEYIPDGILSEGNVGHAAEGVEYKEDETSSRAILDFGILDVDVEEITPKDKSVKFFGTTSDLTVYDLGDNIDSSGKKKYHVGSKIAFKPSYMGTARIMSSKFVEKKAM